MSQSSEIQAIEDVIARTRIIIENATAQIPFSLNLIRNYIVEGQSSGDPVKDLLYLLRTDAIASPGLFQGLTSLHTELTAHAGEFIIVEQMDLVETYHGGPHDTTYFPPREDNASYHVGIIPSTLPLTAKLQSERGETKGLAINFTDSKYIELPILFLVCLEQCGSCADAVFATSNVCEPNAISYGDKRMRFWIGNKRVARCLYRAIFSDKTKGKQLRSDILAIVDQLSPPIPNFKELSKELSRLQMALGESDSVAHAAT